MERQSRRTDIELQAIGRILAWLGELPSGAARRRVLSFVANRVQEQAEQEYPVQTLPAPAFSKDAREAMRVARDNGALFD